MKKIHCLLACAVIIVTGCSGEETAVSMDSTGQAALQESAEMVSGDVAEMPAVSVDEAVLSDMMAAEAVQSATAETMEPVGDALDEARHGVKTAMPEGEAPVTVADPAAAGMAAVDLEQGKKIYSGSCFACHATGVAGAPKLGDAGNWAPRIAQGMDMMATHAINGFKGASGYMPAKGGAGSLTDEEVTAAVAYMASASR